MNNLAIQGTLGAIVFLAIAFFPPVYAPPGGWETTGTIQCGGLPTGFTATANVVLTRNGVPIGGGMVSCADSASTSATFTTQQKPNDWDVRLVITNNNNVPPTTDNSCAGGGVGNNSFPGSVSCPLSSGGAGATGSVGRPSP